MRRKKIENYFDMKPTIEMISSLMPKEISDIRTLLDDIEKNVLEFGDMKHSSFIQARKSLMKVQTKSTELRKTILETHKLFTQDPNDKLQ